MFDVMFMTARRAASGLLRLVLVLVLVLVQASVHGAESFLPRAPGFFASFFTSFISFSAGKTSPP